MKANAGSRDSSSAFTNVLSGSQNTRNSSTSGPRNRRVSASSAVTTKLTRAWESWNALSTRTADLRTHELSLVYGSRITLARWNVVSHCSSGRGSEPSGASTRSAGSLVATASDRSEPCRAGPQLPRWGVRFSCMHPIEHLRYVARARHVDASELVREAAVALGSLRTDAPNLVIACRRIVERHAEVGPMWWLCARMLTSDNPRREAWDIADELECSTVADRLAGCIPDAATVVTIGRPLTVEAALVQRGDVRVLCADA